MRWTYDVSKGGRAAIAATMFMAMWAGTGCSGPELVDDMDVEFDFALTPSDDLHLPYVTGTKVSLIANEHAGEGAPEQSWTLQSSNENVLRIESQSQGRAECQAVGEGTTTMTIFDEEGEAIHDATLEVLDPDHLELVPHGPLFVGVDVDYRSQDINVVAGGTATFEVRYYRGYRRLFGNDVLTAAASTGLSVHTESTFLLEKREWLQLTAGDPGSYEVQLSSLGVPLGSAFIQVRSPDEVASVEIIDDNRLYDEDLEEGDLLTALGVARLADGDPVFGAEFSWDLDGDVYTEFGDLFRYEYVEDADKTLGAEFDGLRAETRIHATHGYVDSSNDLGCSIGRPRFGDGDGSWLLGCIGLAWAACRRRSRRLPY